MNFPVGKVVSKGELPAKFDELAESLAVKQFNGYVVQSIRSHFIEEGVIFFRNGEIVACLVECLALNKSVKSKEALDFFLNQTIGKGYYQVVELSRSQVDLVTAFDEKILFEDKITLKDLPKLIPLKFLPRFEPVKGEENLLEAFGLGALRKSS